MSNQDYDYLYRIEALIGILHEMEEKDTYVFGKFFPNIVEHLTEQVHLDKVPAFKRKMASYVAPLLTARGNKRKGFETHIIAPASIKEKEIVSSEDVYIRLPGEPIGGDYKKNTSQRVVSDLMRYLNNLRDPIRQRLEWMAAEAFIRGQAIIEGDGISAHLNYRRHKDLRITLKDSEMWDKANADIFPQIKKASRLVLKHGKMQARQILLGTKAAELLENNKKMRELMKDSLRGVNSDFEFFPKLPTDAGIERLAKFGDYEYYVYSQEFEPPEIGKPICPLQNNEAMVLAPGCEGWQHYGAHVFKGAPHRGKEFAHSWTNEETGVRSLQLSSRPLLVPYNPNNAVVFEVCPPDKDTNTEFLERYKLL